MWTWSTPPQRPARVKHGAARIRQSRLQRLPSSIPRGDMAVRGGGRYGGGMTALPTSDPDPAEPYQVIHPGGEAAAIVPLSDLRRLRAVERHASAEVLAEAEIEATLEAHREWVAAGRPGAVSHEEAMAELLAQ